MEALTAGQDQARGPVGGRSMAVVDGCPWQARGPALDEGPPSAANPRLGVEGGPPRRVALYGAAGDGRPVRAPSLPEGPLHRNGGLPLCHLQR